MNVEHLIMAIKSKARKNKELSIVAVLTVAAQIFVGQNQNQNISEEVSKVKTEFNQLRLEREQIFVKKDDLQTLNNKIDTVNEKMGRLNERVADIQGFLKRSNRYQISSNYPNFTLTRCE